MTTKLKWSDINPWATVAFVATIVHMAANGFAWPSFSVAVWTFTGIVETSMRKSAERDAETWKQRAFAVHDLLVKHVPGIMAECEAVLKKQAEAKKMSVN